VRSFPRNLVYTPTGTGLGHDLEIRRLWREGKVTSKDILIIGTEQGGEIARYWLPYRPRRIVGIDLYEWPDEWGRIERLAQEQGVHCAFCKMNGSALALKDQSVDLIYSQGVLEHVTDLDGFLSQSHRVLRSSGVFYGMFGPLWHCYGGPHIEALEYDHLLLLREEFLRKAASIGNGWEHWVVNGLYNTYTLAEYLKAIERQFAIRRIGLIGSPQGRAYKASHHETWKSLLHRVAEVDLMISRVSMTATKKEVAELS
jgi:ubiquinone/menaquinone biosynthesis C-methylase UbiE